jgi:hypothetical protein
LAVGGGGGRLARAGTCGAAWRDQCAGWRLRAAAMLRHQQPPALHNLSPSPHAFELLLHWELLEDPRVVSRCQLELRSAGAVAVGGFATSVGLQRLLDEVNRCPFNEAVNNFTAYQDQGDARYAPNHPRNYRFESSVGFVGRQTLQQTPDQLGVSLYEEPRGRLLRFLSRVAGRQLHRSTDENGSVYSYLAMPHHQPPWHFDESHFTAIIYLQNGTAGGAFEYVPFSRPTKSKDDHHGHDIVRQVLMEGDTASVRQVAAEPGSLVFFAGAHALHRAAPVCGATGAAQLDAARIALVFTFSETEGFQNSDETKHNNEWAGRSKL